MHFVFSCKIELTLVIFIGKIPYYPNTPAVRKIIESSNTTFETFGLILKLGKRWIDDVGPALYENMESSPTLLGLRVSVIALLQTA